MTKQLSAAPAPPVPDRANPRYWAPKKRNAYGWLMAIMLLFLMMINWADKAILGIVAAPLMRDLQITPEQFGLVSSAVFLLFGVAQFVAAPIANRVSSKWILLALCLIWSVAQVPIFVFASLPALWFSRILLGAGEGPLAPILMHSIYKWFPRHRSATPAAVGASGVTLGIVVFAPVLAWVAAEFGWQATFIFLALIGVVWAGFWLVLAKEGPYTSMQVEHDIEGTAPPAEVPAAAVDRKVPYLRSILTPSWVLAMLCSFMGYWTFAIATSWLPAYYEEVMGYSTQQAGSVIALPAIWGTIATVGLSWITQYLDKRGVRTRISRGIVLSSATVFAGAFLLLGVLVTNETLRTIAFALGFGTAPALFAATYLVAAEMTSIAQRGALLQVTNALFTSGGLFAPAVAGFLIGSAVTEAQGFANAFLITALLLLAVGVLSMLFINQQRDRARLGLDAG
ncbi:MFS transporter [Haloactinomyces albus]|uniref:MFS family permease n=1 Tax=Haloactinomyces albus TaxID=1352928 RepID=A0AAE3ZI34_9ACTN|nr:MFS transporter [Haloactinomyces albus]MDR7303998.1 MFS family permease [Haloactinomyces albus]